MRRPGNDVTLKMLGAASALAVMVPAWAAGGHHGVDDAAMLDPGTCQGETWFERERGRARTLLHVGPSCRIGPVELELGFDVLRSARSATASSAAVQLKWAQSLGQDWSAGWVVAARAGDRSPHFLGGSVVVPLTWRATDTLVAHLNVGRDFNRGEADSNRSGLAIEWAPVNRWSLVGERFRQGGSNMWRVGVRWSPAPSISLDASRATGLHGDSLPWWTVGVAWVFDR